LIANQYERIVNVRDFHDPSGNFLIEVQDGQIIVQQTTRVAVGLSLAIREKFP
jgi:thymidylate synthase